VSGFSSAPKAEIEADFLEFVPCRRIPRSEVEEIAEFVASALATISSGCTYTICGGQSPSPVLERDRSDDAPTCPSPPAGYRRGKDCSNDVDLIFTHESGDASRVSRNVLDRLMEELSRLGESIPFIFLLGLNFELLISSSCLFRYQEPSRISYPDLTLATEERRPPP